MSARFPVLTLLCACTVLASACTQEQRYVVEAESVAMTTETPPYFVDEDDNEFFLVERRDEFPVTPPPMDVDFNEGIEDRAPFPRGPWVFHGDFAMELDWVLTNTMDQSVEAAIVVNGINEFHEYTPGPLDFHQWEKRYRLGPLERRSGTIRDLELDELAVDLATVVNGAPNSNQIVYRDNQSQTDARSQPFIPAVIPGLVGLRIGLATTEAVNLLLEISVRITDHGGRLAERGDEPWELPTPTAFAPVVPEI